MNRRAFSVLVKPVGPRCNLRCSYCFYLEKISLYPQVQRFRMTDAVLEAFVRQYIAALDIPEIGFIWQGGEPTLLGIGFFENVLRLQRTYADGKRITNSIQTNGTLLDDAWCEFLAENRFLTGLSLDGPEGLHDACRVDIDGNPTFWRVMRGAALMKKHGVEFNTLTVVNRLNSYYPREVYRFLKEAGSGFIQFIPLVERADLQTSVEPEQYGTFLVDVFDEWVRSDVGKVFVQLFDVALGNWAGFDSSLCLFTETCGTALALEHNGDLYCCDHFVDPSHCLGNIMQQGLSGLAAGAAQKQFGYTKSACLPRICRQCEVRFACHGECPKNRFMRSAEGQEGLNYLCPAYKRFFRHIDGPMRTMVKLLRARRSPAEIMTI